MSSSSRPAGSPSSISAAARSRWASATSSSSPLAMRRGQHLGDDGQPVRAQCPGATSRPAAPACAVASALGHLRRRPVCTARSAIRIDLGAGGADLPCRSVTGQRRRAPGTAGSTVRSLLPAVGGGLAEQLEQFGVLRPRPVSRASGAPARRGPAPPRPRRARPSVGGLTVPLRGQLERPVRSCAAASSSSSSMRPRARGGTAFVDDVQGTQVVRAGVVVAEPCRGFPGGEERVLERVLPRRGPAASRCAAIRAADPTAPAALGRPPG